MTFLRNCWYVAGFSSELGRTPLARTILGEPIVMYRSEAGAVVMLDNRCPHRLAPLSKGTLVGDDIQCAYHGLRFGPGGQCTRVPSGGPVPPMAKIRPYPAAERHALLWVWMGDPALARTEAIPDLSALEDPAFGWYDECIPAKANYQLLVDNLLDGTHAEFLHPMLSSPGFTARNEQKIRQEGNSFIIDNIARDDNIMPLMAALMPHMGRTGTTIEGVHWHAPSILYLSIEYYSGDDQFVIHAGHFLTPETATTTHYFTRGGQSVAPDSAEATEGMKVASVAIFVNEDVPIVEAQQLHLGDADLLKLPLAVLEADAPSIRVRRFMARKIRDEQAVLAEAAA